MLPVVIYAAKSTDDVRGSIPTQLEDCRKAVEAAGGREIVGTFQDEARSAYKGNRGDGLRDARAAAAAAGEAHGGSELWVQHSDRLARGDGLTADHLAEVYFATRRQHVRLRSVQDDSNLEDVIRVALMGERNHEDSARKSAAVRSGKDRQMAAGTRLGGPVPDGLRKVIGTDGARVETTYQRDSERAPIIEEAFALSESGYGDAAIASRLNNHGHRTAKGKGWTRRRIQDLLTNPIYAGRIVRHRGTAAEETAPATNVAALIDGDRFDSIRSKRAERDRSAVGRAKAKGGRPTTRYALAGLATCGQCGELMYASTSPYKRKDGTQARHYVCKNTRTETGLCDAPKINAEAADAAIVPHLREFFLDYANWSAQVREATHAERTSLEREIEAVRGRLRGLERAQEPAHERYVAALAEGKGTAADAALKALERIQSDSERLTAAADSLRERHAALAEEAEPTDSMIDYWMTLAGGIRGRLDSAETLAEVNAELRAALSSVVMETADGGHTLSMRPLYRVARQDGDPILAPADPTQLEAIIFPYEGLPDATPRRSGG